MTKKRKEEIQERMRNLSLYALGDAREADRLKAHNELFQLWGKHPDLATDHRGTVDVRGRKKIIARLKAVQEMANRGQHIYQSELLWRMLHTLVAAFEAGCSAEAMKKVYQTAYGCYGSAEEARFCAVGSVAKKMYGDAEED